MYFQISTGFFEICAFYYINEIVLSRIFKICVSNFITSALSISKFYKSLFKLNVCYLVSQFELFKLKKIMLCVFF